MACPHVCNSTKLNFPNDFIFGAATASYQVEGAWNVSGKGENIWDRLTHEHPELIANCNNGDIACDSYHKYKEDVQLLKELNVDFYRFSISWSRVLPTGYTNCINKDGIRYYNDLINELLSYNIMPMVTIFHWDLPQPLHEIGGWPNIELAQLYVDYARVLFENFGDRVKMWITFNEPLIMCQFAYADKMFAPGYASQGIGNYMAGRTLLLAHAMTYRMYEKEFKSTQKGRVGITLISHWYEPKTDDPKDIELANRSVQLTLGWWAHPIFSKTGDYPEEMKQIVDENSKLENFPRSRLKPFSKDEINLIKGTSDFFGLNYYTTEMITNDIPGNTGCNPKLRSAYNVPSLWNDIGGYKYYDPSWPGSSADWLKVVPWGLRKLLNWIKVEYNNPEVYITENGFADYGEINDVKRIDYYKKHFIEILKAINEDNCIVKGFTAWSLMDNFEWREGYRQKFGLYQVDFEDPKRTRRPKKSAEFYKNVIIVRTIIEDVCVICLWKDVTCTTFIVYYTNDFLKYGTPMYVGNPQYKNQ